MSRRGLSADGVNRLYLFLFFVVGALAAQLSIQELAIQQGRALAVWGMLFPLAAALLLSVSAAGVILIPVTALGLGAVCGLTANGLVEDLPVLGLAAGKEILVLFLTVPVFFAVAVRGMALSSVLCACLERQRRSFGGNVFRPFVPMTAAVLLVGAVRYFL